MNTPKLIKQNIPENETIYIYERKHSNSFKYPYHYHNLNQLLFIVAGKGELILNDKKYTIKKNDLIIIKKGDNHKLTDAPSTWMTVYIINYLDEIFKINGEHLSNFINQLSDNNKIINLNNIFLSHLPLLLKRMLFEISQKGRNYQLKLYTNLLNILIAINEFIKQPISQNIPKTTTSKPNITEEKIVEVINFLQQHYYENYTLDQIAQMAHLSKRHFTRIFKKITNFTLKQYINKIRLAKAKELILNSDKEIIYICYEVGFEDLSYFYKMFKQEYNITPTKLRQSIINNKVL